MNKENFKHFKQCGINGLNCDKQCPYSIIEKIKKQDEKIKKQNKINQEMIYNNIKKDMIFHNNLMKKKFIDWWFKNTNYIKDKDIHEITDNTFRELTEKLFPISEGD